MQVHTNTTHHFQLDPGEFFRHTEQYVERDVEIEVHRIDVSIRGDLIAAGPKIKADGKPGATSAKTFIEVGELPIFLLCKMLTNFIKGA